MTRRVTRPSTPSYESDTAVVNALVAAVPSRLQALKNCDSPGCDYQRADDVLAWYQNMPQQTSHLRCVQTGVYPRLAASHVGWMR
jgi:hypothetical protein